MEFLTGLVTGLTILVVYVAGVKMGAKQKPKVEVDEQEQRRAKEFHEDFQSLMNYDVSQAMQRKKVI